jgi:tetratricopeptide (TPR) repeat protein
MIVSSSQAGKKSSGASMGLVAAAMRSGNVMQARLMLQDRLAHNPNDPDALEKLAEIAAGQRSIEEATILLQRAVAIDPSVPRRMALIAHLRRNAPALALAEIEQLPQAVRDDHEMRGVEATLAGSLGMHDRQIRLYRAMTRERSGDPSLWVSLANALKTVGRTDEALKALQRAIRVDQGYGDAWWTLANFKSYKFTHRDIAQMQAALRSQPGEHDALHIHFALGKAYEDRGEYEESFRHYAVGNAIRARTFDPDDVTMTPLVDSSIATFTPDLFDQNRNVGCPDEGPIFVVGLHRSGSTLIEQILASHSQVEGTTELGVMKSLRERLARSTGKPAAEAIAALTPAEARAIGEEYLSRTRPFRQTDRPYFVDKLPGNWANLALIRIALPNARIVDARRHPMACGFSNFKQNYASGAGFSYSLEWIGTFYRDYWRFMRHFEEVEPGVVCRMINEQLIDRPEAEVRRMLDHLRLPFEASCLEFHKNERAVRTPSAEQVRKPINREGVDYWRHYEPWLDELKRSLGPALQEWAD